MKKLIVLLVLFVSLAVSAQDRPACGKITKYGTACKNRVQEGKTTCGVHIVDPVRCGADTRAGSKCKNRVKSAGLHCSKHSGK